MLGYLICISVKVAQSISEGTLELGIAVFPRFVVMINRAIFWDLELDFAATVEPVLF